MSEKPHILLVEDSSKDVEILLTYFGEADDFEVTVLHDGEQALNYLYARGDFETKAKPVALMLLDLKMPKVSGMEVLRQLRSDRAFRSLPVVVITSSNQERDLMGAYNLDAQGYVIKPIQPEQLRRTISAALRG